MAAKNLQELHQQAVEYTEAYAAKYDTADEVSLRSIFFSHLAHLLNTQ